MRSAALTETDPQVGTVHVYAFARLKAAALYFDSISVLREQLHADQEQWDELLRLPYKLVGNPSPKLARDGLDHFLEFGEGFYAMSNASISIVAAMVDKLMELRGKPERLAALPRETPEDERKHALRCLSLATRFGIFEKSTGLVAGVADDAASHAQEPTLELASINVIDTSGINWQDIFEMRRDDASMRRLRSLRQFFNSNYAGKSKAEVEEDLAARIHDYERAAKKLGIGLLQGSIVALLGESATQTTAAASLASALLQEPQWRWAPFSFNVAGAVLNFGTRRRAGQLALARDPVAYLVDIRSKVGSRG